MQQARRVFGMRHQCPECSSNVRERVHGRGVVARLARVLGWHHYRCVDCGHRFYDRAVRRRDP